MHLWVGGKRFWPRSQHTHTHTRARARGQRERERGGGKGLANLSVVVDVELKEEHLILGAHLVHFVQGARGEGWPQLHNTARRCCACQAQLAVGVCKAAKGTRGDVHGHLDAVPKHRAPQVNVGHIHLQAEQVHTRIADVSCQTQTWRHAYPSHR